MSLLHHKALEVSVSYIFYIETYLTCTLDYIGIRHLNSIHEKAQEAIDESENPLEDLYDFLHSLCQALELDILHKQAESMTQAPGTVFITDIQIEEGTCLKFNIWHTSDTERNFRMSLSCSPPAEKFEGKKPAGLVISHSPPLLDQHGNEVYLHTDPKSVSLESLVSQATKYHALNLLKQLYDKIVKSLERRPQLNESNTIYFNIMKEDVSLLYDEDLTYLLIKIRLFESYTISILVSQRTGQFTIQDMPDVENLDIKHYEDLLARSTDNIMKVILDLQLATVRYGTYSLLKSLNVNVQTKIFHKELTKLGKDIFFLKLLPYSLYQNIVLKFSTSKALNHDGELEYGCVNIKMYKLSYSDTSELPLDKISAVLATEYNKSHDETTQHVNSNAYPVKRQKVEDHEIKAHSFDGYLANEQSSLFNKILSKIISSYTKHIHIFLLLDLFKSKKVVLNQEETEDPLNPPFEYTMKFELPNFKRDAHLSVHNEYFVVSMELKDGLKYPVSAKYSERSTIYYDDSTKTWHFKYQYGQDSVNWFKVDYLKLVELLKLLDQYEYYSKNIDLSGDRKSVV